MGVRWKYPTEPGGMNCFQHNPREGASCLLHGVSMAGSEGKGTSPSGRHPLQGGPLATEGWLLFKCQHLLLLLRVPPWKLPSPHRCERAPRFSSASPAKRK